MKSAHCSVSGAGEWKLLMQVCGLEEQIYWTMLLMGDFKSEKKKYIYILSIYCLYCSI